MDYTMLDTYLLITFFEFIAYILMWFCAIIFFWKLMEMIFNLFR